MQEFHSGDSDIYQINQILEGGSNQSLSDFSVHSNECQSMYGSFDQIQHRKGSVEGISTMTPNHSCVSNLKDQLSFVSQDHDYNFSQKSFEDDYMFTRRIEKKQIQFKSAKLAPAYMKLVIETLSKFVQSPSEDAFYMLLQNINQYQQSNPFKNDSAESSLQNKQNTELALTFQELFYRNKNTFLIFTFDFVMCHLSFVSALLFYWVKISRVVGEENQISQIKSKLLKSHVFNILRSYIDDRTQEINYYEVIFIVVFYFLNYLRNLKSFQFNDVTSTQKKLLNSIKLFRKVRKKEHEFSTSATKFILDSQMKKYEYEHKLTHSLQQTYLIITLINLSNFAQIPLAKFYQVNGFEKSREQYQRKKDIFCIWILQIIIHIFEKNTNESLYKAANYIITFMSILKKFKESKNFQGISYLLPVIQNVKVLLPKVWKHAVNRRNQVQPRLNQYNKLLIQKQFEKQQFQYFSSPVIWHQTIYEIVDKFKQQYKPQKQSINLKHHEQFYKQVIKKLSLYQKKSQQEYQRQLELYHRQKQIGISFNMYLLDSYIFKMYKGKNLGQEWQKIKSKARKLNQQISISIYSELIDHYFIGSQVKYKRVDL